jgi:predicted RNA polymerase sigma factor
MAEDELALIFMCCHPAPDPEAGIALTLRCVCGLATADIAAAFVVPDRRWRSAWSGPSAGSARPGSG